jgi:hypothetical protein
MRFTLCLLLLSFPLSAFAQAPAVEAGSAAAVRAINRYYQEAADSDRNVIRLSPTADVQLPLTDEIPLNLSKEWKAQETARPHRIKAAEAEYKLAEKGRIGRRSRFDGPGLVASGNDSEGWRLQDGRGKVIAFTFPSKAAKQKELTKLKSRIAEAKDTTLGLPEFHSNDLPRVGDVGEIKDAWVLSVVDEQNVIVQLIRGAHGDDPIWIAGVDAAALADGKHVRISSALKATGTRTYATAIGGQRTAILLQPVSDEQLKQWRDRIHGKKASD